MELTFEEMERVLGSADVQDELVLFGQQEGAKSLVAVLKILGGPRGCDQYIPSMENFFGNLKRMERDIEICNRYDGTNTSQLSIEHKLHPRRIQQIVKAQKTAKEID